MPLKASNLTLFHDSVSHPTNPPYLVLTHSTAIHHRTSLHSTKPQPTPPHPSPPHSTPLRPSPPRPTTLAHLVPHLFHGCHAGLLCLATRGFPLLPTTCLGQVAPVDVVRVSMVPLVVHETLRLTSIFLETTSQSFLLPLQTNATRSPYFAPIDYYDLYSFNLICQVMHVS